MFKQIQKIKENSKYNAKITMIILGLPIIVGVCNNYFFGISDYRDTVPNNNVAMTAQKETAKVETTANNGVKPPNYSDCMNVANLDDRKYCLQEASKLIK